MDEKKNDVNREINRVCSDKVYAKTTKNNGKFLQCRCHLEGGIEIERVENILLGGALIVCDLEPLTTCRLATKCAASDNWVRAHMKLDTNLRADLD